LILDISQNKSDGPGISKVNILDYDEMYD